MFFSCQATKDGRKWLFASEKDVQLAATFAHGAVGALHQGGNVGVVQVEQVEAAIAEVGFCEVGVGFAKTDGKLAEVAVDSLAQRRDLLLAQRILYNQDNSPST